MFVVGEGFDIAVSPDGRRLAYWGPDGLELRVLDIAPDARPRTLLTFTTPQPNHGFGGSVVWSSDGTGLVIGVVSGLSGPGIDAPPEYSALRLIEAAGGQPREIVRLQGTTLVPLAWDRQARLVTAYEPTGGGARAYDIIEEGGTLERTQAGCCLFFPQASHDAQQVLAGLFPTTVLKVWPVASFARAVELRAAGGERILAARWRPGTAEIGVLFDDRLELWDASGARRPVPLPPLPPSGARRPVPLPLLPRATGPNASLVFRADGSAVFVGRVLDTSSTGSRPDVYGVAVDLASGRTAIVQMGGFLPGASVRIGP